MITLIMFEGVLSDGEQAKFYALRDLATTRLETRIRSMREARDILDRAQAKLEAAEAAKMVANKLYDEAIIALAEDEDDDYVTAAEKAGRFEKIEYDFLNADDVIARARKQFDNASLRVRWELGEAKRLGYTGGDKRDV